MRTNLAGNYNIVHGPLGYLTHFIHKLAGTGVRLLSQEQGKTYLSAKQRAKPETSFEFDKLHSLIAAFTGSTQK